MITNIIFRLMCIVTLYTVWKIQHRCKTVVKPEGTRFAQLTSYGQFVSRWLLTTGSTIGLLWGRNYTAESCFYLAIASYLLSACRYYKVGGRLGALLYKLKW